MKMRMLPGLLLAALLVGCGADAAPPTTVPTEPEVREEIFTTEPEALAYEGVRLTFAPGVGENTPEGDVYRQAAWVFQAETGAEVQLLWGGDATGDIYALPWGGDASGALDLTELTKGTDYDAHSFPLLRQQVAEKYGHLAGLPHIPYAGGLYYLTGVFDSCGIEAPPRTWADFESVCHVLKSQGWEALALNTEDAYQASWLHFQRSLGTFGPAQAGQVELLAEQIIEFRKAGLLAPGTPADYPGGQNRLALSNAAMTVGTNALCAQVERSTGMALDWGVFPWPGGDGGSGCYAYSDLLCVSAGAENPQAAFDFVLLLCTGEFDQLRADVTNGIPADPANASPVRGAFSILEKAGTDGIPAPAGKEKSAAKRLWTGRYGSGKDFSKVWFDPA